ncbi:dethiobiotin synthase [Gloeothece citriformis PCC 7424]|uniref:ATP-dependent dethiobiotin synthetase BioD n=1 Tax=Gloeothece citriformis (strain PCC 7424) TaxID=65393 RepID=BIOD_GLOC7|nr:dethiobiotin synthase [Gloeothece citriformis]B7KBS1.1 RecName: Full=ATP-dependent dethiobiotin synthetase BioD; AltName: Full=DTB synthetase; Short=DTBS; AltName: Full=Dethiobiotin synthase [Gloeothece citriformis PCC 7424]ACK73049.1 dethiobiotin synthase [Gloeothece citriformis PCC 7424]
MAALLITATDTEVGKTVLTTSLTAYWQTYRGKKGLGLMKLLQTGVGDQERYHQLFGADSSIEIKVPLWFKTPVAPPVAAAAEGKTIDLKRVWQEFCALQQRQSFVLLEALGGLGSPVTEELTVADIAGQWRLETVLVVPVKLGAIAQAVANVALARQHQIKLKGIILNCSQPISEEQLKDWTPINLIQSLTSTPVLGILPYISDLNDLEKLTQAASTLDLEKLLPL